jgi:Transcriptional Coactivator p15 (PC4)
MTAKPPPLPEPIEICKFWKNRRRDKAIVVSLSAYEETNIVNVREHFVGSDGIMRPTTKGIATSVRRLPELSNALRKALERARALNLLPEDGSE